MTSAELAIITLTGYKPEKYATEIDLDETDQLQKDMQELGEHIAKAKNKRVAFVVAMSVPHIDDSAQGPLELTYAAVYYLLQRDMLADDSFVVINKNGFRAGGGGVPVEGKLDRVPPKFEMLGEGLLIARASDLPKPTITVDDDGRRAPRTRSSRSRSL